MRCIYECTFRYDYSRLNLNRRVVTRNDPNCGMDGAIRPCTNSAVSTGFRGNGALFNI